MKNMQAKVLSKFSWMKGLLILLVGVHSSHSGFLVGPIADIFKAEMVLLAIQEAQVVVKGTKASANFHGSL